MKKITLSILALSLILFIPLNSYSECRLTGISNKRITTVKGDCNSKISREGICAGGGCYFSPTNFEQLEAFNTEVECNVKIRLRQIKTYTEDCRRQRKVKRKSGITIHLFEHLNSANEENPNFISESTTNKRGIANLIFTYNENACYYQASKLKKKDNSIGRHLLGIQTFKYYMTDGCFDE